MVTEQIATAAVLQIGGLVALTQLASQWDTISGVEVLMNTRVFTLFSLLAAMSITTVAQNEPVLSSASMPKYPPLACQARVQGSVKLTFTLPANGTEPANVRVVSGHPLLNGAAMESVKTWRFDNPYAVERKYETMFEYRLSDRVLAPGQQRKLSVSLESFHKLEVVSDAYGQPSIE